MAVQTEIWVRYIMNRLWKDNTFLQYAFSDDQYVVGGKIVHIPQPGSKPNIVKNRNTYPAAAVQRTDTDILYALDRYTSDPTHIEAADLLEITYDKISSVFGDHAGTLVETIADDMIIKWLSGIGAGNILRTTGAATASKVTGQTGNRKAFSVLDAKRAQTKMNLMKVLKTDRYAMLESNHMDEFTDGLTVNQEKQFSEYYDAKEGIVGKLFGFTFLERTNVAIATSANAIEALGASVDATDNVVSMFWQKDSVTRAIGEKKFFERKDDPEYYGDMYSALLRAGGRRRRADDAGVIAMIQDTAS
ncbi:hypothetical protein [Chryseosolibacter indicus]|uniref:Uncharacterized protein n=1 Tax=Chryseosolibacter indicus TaxID=2782351 RepID=A0ABS5VNL7_9BACT|nr:hypothetical protein [Chryseosolibacter indicus]MBT1702951.1 hypothetical protein [Chryseosolibacter indicus]